MELVIKPDWFIGMVGIGLSLLEWFPGVTI